MGTKLGEDELVGRVEVGVNGGEVLAWETRVEVNETSRIIRAVLINEIATAAFIAGIIQRKNLHK